MNQYLKEAAEQARDFANYLDGLQKAITLPDFGEMSIKEGFKRLHLAFGREMTCSIQSPRVIYYGHTQEYGFMDKWSVYIHNGKGDNGIQAFESNPLAPAVNDALASVSPPPADPVGDIQKALTPAPF